MLVHSRLLPAALIEPAATDDVRPQIEELVRDILWPIARRRMPGRILNRVRVTSGGPLLPYRILVIPLVRDERVVGLVAALRAQDAPAYTAADLLVLREAAPDLLDKLNVRSTGRDLLLDRTAFERQANHLMQSAQVACVVYADLDQMHAINETAGFEAGDEVIHEVGSLWHSQLLPPGSVAAHLSGDRHAAVLVNHTINQARAWADQLREALGQLVFHNGRRKISASLGVASLSRGASFQHALAAAETACRVAKERGRDRTEIYSAADATIMRRHDAVHESRVLMNALEDRRCHLFAQPIVTLTTPVVPVHYELLVRIEQLDGQFTSVGQYIKAAEQYQLLEQLDRWVVGRALEMLAPHAQRLTQLGVSFAINLTGQSLSEPQFADFVRTEAKRHEIPRGLLSFEFTETAAIRNLAATRRFIERMKDIGARIALDDFGTGLSSLMHLKELAIDQIKIDGSFIRDVLTDARSQALVRALAQIADNIGLETVAEFVETEEVAARLRSLGVRLAQGYLYGRPRPLTQYLAPLIEAQPGEMAEARAS
ncbi:MAG: hypothetical protein RL684_1141 [Pseudomonadota bacterium]